MKPKPFGFVKPLYFTCLHAFSFATARMLESPRVSLKMLVSVAVRRTHARIRQTQRRMFSGKVNDESMTISQ